MLSAFLGGSPKPDVIFESVTRSKLMIRIRLSLFYSPKKNCPGTGSGAPGFFGNKWDLCAQSTGSA